MSFLNSLFGAPPQKPSTSQNYEFIVQRDSEVAACSDGWFMPQFRGRDICEWVDEISSLKRQGDLPRALELAHGCMESMIEAAQTSSANVMEFYVSQVVIIQHKMKDYEGELQTLESWFSLGLPAARQDHRLELEKRRAKALELVAKKNGEDHASYTAEWKRLVELEKQAKSSCVGNASTTGRSRIDPTLSHSRLSSKHRSRSQWTAPTEVLSSPRFVAVDFETANPGSGVSACQIALIKIDHGKIVDRFITLIKPPVGFDSFEFTYLHGISARHVRRAPSWNEIASAVGSFVEGLPVYSHNAPFDSRVWEELDEFFGTRTRPEVFYCSYRTTRHLMPGLENYKLPTVTKALVPGFKLNHHEASSDAEACGLIIAALQTLYC
ncbi:3'-5' exonuclease [Arcanobacterium phocae]|uniref:3'-5' exonuclease n=1 Tax=Arcanobacterium phocae TaxID=131112 RepID=UPI001C0EAFB8|nr:3'-5' exonuclease [Arcanobacterium phocae]